MCCVVLLEIRTYFTLAELQQGERFKIENRTEGKVTHPLLAKIFKNLWKEIVPIKSIANHIEQFSFFLKFLFTSHV